MQISHVNAALGVGYIAPQTSTTLVEAVQTLVVPEKHWVSPYKQPDIPAETLGVISPKYISGKKTYPENIGGKRV